MKLTKESIKHNVAWKGYRLPQYDIDAVRENTHKAPTWLHFGAGNLFRAFPAVLAQRLLTAGLSDTGIICCDGYDEELIDRCYRACDHLSLVVTLYSNGTINKEVVASVTESLKLSEDMLRLKDIFLAPSLQMISFTLTEKGYIIQDDTREFLPDYKHDRENGPEGCQSFFGKLTALCLDRCRAGLSPLALVSLDNCSDNGTRLERAVRHMARAWQRGGFITEDEYYFLLKKNTFPLSMIDKITPHPDNRIADKLAADGLENAKPFVTEKGTHAAVYVNSESPHYLLIENAFPNGHPALEQCGVIITRRDIVEKSAMMKVSTCMNPMDTALGVFGCMLGYTRISDEMKDTELVNLITRLSEQEAMPMVADPGVIDPEAFLHEVLGERYPNPFLQDSPQRTATDTSRKIAPRFGTTLYAYYNSMLPAHRATRLIYIPLVLAGWLRYLEGVDDNGSEFTLSPDANIEHVRALMGNPKLGDDVSEAQLYPLLANRYYFGVNLFEIGVGETVVRMFGEMNRGPHAVRETLQKYCGEEAYPLPAECYQGGDIKVLAGEFAELNGDKYVAACKGMDEETLFESEAFAALKDALVTYALPKNIAALKRDLGKYRIDYDVWFHESTLHESGAVKAVVDKLLELGACYKAEDGAIMYRSAQYAAKYGTVNKKKTEDGTEEEAKDEVLVRANGIPTYFAADIAYHYNKLATRGFAKAIDVWGADHHGHVARMKGAMDAIGLNGEDLDVVLMQMVNLMRDGQPVRMSKRTGNAITLTDLLEEVPIDSARFLFNMHDAGSGIDFDLDQAVKTDNDNPVYYVQYAHARICSILKKMESECI